VCVLYVIDISDSNDNDNDIIEILSDEGEIISTTKHKAKKKKSKKKKKKKTEHLEQLISIDLLKKGLEKYRQMTLEASEKEGNYFYNEAEEEI